MTAFSTWIAPPNLCFVTGGFLNKKGGTPICSVNSSYIVTVSDFHEILFRNMDGLYIIKI
jgi:hypothetical protein